MCIALRVSSWIVVLLSFAFDARAAQKPFIDCSPEELKAAVPEFARLEFDSDQNVLAPLLRSSGETLASMFAKRTNLSAREEINELRFDDNMGGTNRREAFRYELKMQPPGGPDLFQEVRMDVKTNAPVHGSDSNNFLVLSNFFGLLDYLFPGYQEQSRFRYIGRSKAPYGQVLFVVVFAQRPEGTKLHSHIETGSNGETAPMQGIVWIDAATKEIVRLRLDLLQPVDPFQTLITDISLVRVNFRTIGAISLPACVTVTATFGGGQVHSVHRYSHYEAAREKGASEAEPTSEDAYELLARGFALLQGSKSREAIRALREAAQLGPAVPSIHFNLANALLSVGDVNGGELESRETLKLAPGSGVAHNLLGIILSRRGDVSGAVVEFRRSVEIQPKASTVHFNLAQALEKLGDRRAALGEYRTASELDPGSAVLKARYEQFDHVKNAGSLPEGNIKVDVRQVLVPVIVATKDGHRVTARKQEDFRVFEDGIEQKISAFDVEDASETSSRIASGPEPVSGKNGPAPNVSTNANPIGQTYVICMDTLHSAAANITSVRQALMKMFESERSRKSRYIVMVVGTSSELVQGETSDPEQVLQAIRSKNFQKVWAASRKTERDYDLQLFRTRLDQVRLACDQRQSECSMKSSFPGQVRQFGSRDQIYNQAFFSQFKSIVEQLTHGEGRRTIVLISDGFQLVPGKQAFDLLMAYFPELRSMALPTSDRMRELDPILHLAANNNISIYTIDSRGLYTPAFFEAANPASLPRVAPDVLTVTNTAATESGDTLSEIAGETGGTSFHNSNDMLAGLKRAFADGRQYYVLAYVSGNSNRDGSFRAISVQVRDTHLAVHAKRGYWAETN